MIIPSTQRGPIIRIPILSSNGQWKWSTARPAARSGKLDQYVYTFPQEYHQYGETFANPRGKFRGITQMPGAKFYGGFSVVLKPNVMEVPHIHHANDEYLWFTGADSGELL